ncbi:precorrin-3B synthase [Amycolatopsis cynarae]|uniref:Precorrin-3B synthase n=1 Tax=Amycolatopsis cynarae TaxID=2995223 RepID=A0ABY7B6D8_9PSEU|nr:precorrin-3B synthase [Amycolatopsis sp. HUAS 11-8]WAL66984.1 precorrin-3B synthase [Amycolatopsis sp. HUAS 11-8]
MAIPARARPDACPGVFATHEAADGFLARVRLPGGCVSAVQLGVLAACAEDLGDGSVHLTSRANIQFRGLSRDTGDLAGRLAAAGLLPAPAHERVRNYLASPLSGLAGGLLDVRPLVRELDTAVCARPELAGLPGRFLFALDDGRGDMAAEEPDLCWQAVDGDAGILLRAGEPGERVPVTGAVDALVREALRFLEIRGTAWRMRELSGFSGGKALPVGKALPAGPFARDDGGQGLCLVPLFGELSAARLRTLAEAAPEVVVTPWRSVVVPGYDPALGPALLALSTDRGVSACIGLPGCAKSRADVRADARRTTSAVPAHFSGCERRCGKPRGAADVVAADGGYLIDGAFVPVEGLADFFAATAQKGQR